MSKTTIMEIGYACLIEKLGVLETERFVDAIKNDHFDYTEWHHNLFDGMTIKEFLEKASAAAKDYVPPDGVKII